MRNNTLSVLLAAAVVVVGVGAPEPLAGQTPSSDLAGRDLKQFRIAAGVGNYVGGVGLQGEIFLVDSKLSLVGGVGQAGEIFDVRDLNGAVAVRGYFLARAHHGGFLSGGISPLTAVQTCIDSQGSSDCSQEIVADGPGISAGYRFETNAGFSVEGLIGYGWVQWVEANRGIEQGDGYPLYALTVGYSF